MKVYDLNALRGTMCVNDRGGSRMYETGEWSPKADQRGILLLINNIQIRNKISPNTYNKSQT